MRARQSRVGAKPRKNLSAGCAYSDVSPKGVAYIQIHINNLSPQYYYFVFGSLSLYEQYRKKKLRNVKDIKIKPFSY